MDPVVRTSIVIGITIFLKGLITEWWERFKEREKTKPIPMKLKNGVYVPWGRLQKAQRFFDWCLRIWLVYMAVLLIALFYVKIIAA